LNFVTSSSLGSGSKILAAPVTLNRGKKASPLVTGLLRRDGILQQVEGTALDMFSVGLTNNSFKAEGNEYTHDINNNNAIRGN